MRRLCRPGPVVSPAVCCLIGAFGMFRLDGGDPSEPYVRCREGGGALAMEIAARTLEPAGGQGPAILLVGAMHYAEPAYYESLRGLLDGQDLVLYEGVKPYGVDPATARTDASRVRKTETAVRCVAGLLEVYRSEKKTHPGSLAALAEGLGEREQAWLAKACRDAWDRPLLYEKRGDSFSLASLGADGEPGGEGICRDLAFSDQIHLRPVEAADDSGPEKGFARTLGLAFQKEILATDGPAHRRSDLDMNQIQRALAAQGGDPRLLDAFIAGAQGGVRPGVPGDGALPPGQRSLLLGGICRNLAATQGRPDRVPGLDPAVTKLMGVLVERRNDAVLEDLKEVLSEGKDAPAKIAILYGAGHLADLESRIVAGLGYRPAATRWYKAIGVEVGKVRR